MLAMALGLLCVMIFVYTTELCTLFNHNVNINAIIKSNRVVIKHMKFAKVDKNITYTQTV